MCRAESGDGARARPGTSVSPGDPGARANPRRLAQGCYALCRRAHREPGYDLIRDTARVDLDATSKELSRLEVVEPRITLPSLETGLAAAEGWEAVQGSRRRVCTRCLSQNHDCWRRAGRSPDPDWPLQWEASSGRRRWPISCVCCSATRKPSCPCPATGITAVAAGSTSAWSVNRPWRRRCHRRL
jgi:hypothetical protein